MCANVDIHDMNRLDTSNKNHYIFSSGELEFHVLGGFSLHGLDRMRVTLKVNVSSNPYHALRHNIDLYNSNSTEKLVRKIAEFLSVGTSVVRKGLLELIDKLERHRIELLESAEEPSCSFVMNDSDKRTAMDILSSADLMERTDTLISVSGVIGEMKNRVLMYLIFTSRLMENPLHCISFGSSGSGKTHLQSKIASLCLLYTSPSPRDKRQSRMPSSA